MVQVPADSMSGGDLLPGSQMAILLLCPHMTEGARELSGGLFHEGTNHLPKSPPSNTTTLGGRVAKYEFGGIQHSVYSTHPHLPLIQFENYMFSHLMLPRTLSRLISPCSRKDICSSERLFNLSSITQLTICRDKPKTRSLGN